MAAGKPIPQLKKLPPSDAMAAFVESETQPQPVPTTPAQAKAPTRAPRVRSKKASKEGAVTKKVTYYFPPELERRLAIYAATNGLKMTNIVVEAVESFLDRARK